MKVWEKAGWLFEMMHRLGAGPGLRAFPTVISKRKGLATIRLNGMQEPLWVRRASSDIALFRQLFVGGEYDFDLDVPPAVIVDLGANIGLSARLFRQRWPGCRVVAVEVDKENIGMLQRNTAGDGMITVVQAGIWYREARLVARDEWQMGHWGMVVSETSDDDPEGLPAISIPVLMQRYQLDVIDLLKVDIEGAELELFSRGSDSWLPRVRNIVVETHDRYRPGTAKAVWEALRGYDFEMTITGDCLLFRNLRSGSAAGIKTAGS